MKVWRLGLLMLAGCGPAQPDAGLASDAVTSASPGAEDGTHGSSSAPVVDASSTSGALETTSGSPQTSSAVSSSGSEASGDATTTTGRPGRTPTLELWQVTDTNRAYVEMQGGWGPHLRAPMTASDGSVWFAYDGGPNVSSNTTIHYRRFDGAQWNDVASQAHIPGVQQNAAHVLRNDILLSYAVSVGSSVLEECYLDVNDLGTRACNVINTGASYTTPPSSNYVGAALDPNGAKIVWFTVVGASGGTGQFIYTYDFGSGWNGPVVQTLPGYNDFAYVRAFAPEPNAIEWVGQAYIGAYPNGDYAVGAHRVALGIAPTFATLGPPVGPNETVRTAGDLWIDPETGDSHALARVDGDTYLFHKPAGDAWSEHVEPVDVLEGVVQSRWLHADGEPRMLLARGGGPLRALWQAEPDTLWSEAESLPIEVPAGGFDSTTAIYTAGPEYQTEPVTHLDFALCGTYQVADQEIWHGRIRWE
ncbi:MAG: hypothetical protein AAGA54_04655 [Myxococcota bacterium]